MTREEIIKAVRTGVRCENLLQPSKNKMFCCPFCGSGTHGTASSDGAVKVYDDNKWTCHACHESGDSIDLLQHINKTDFEGAITIGFKMLGSSVNFAPVPAKKTSDKKKNNQDFRKYYAECADRLSEEEPVTYLKSRGISYETAHRLFVGYDPQSDPAFAPGGEGEMRYPRKRIIIPTTASHYVGRSIDADQSHNKVNNKGGSPGIFNSKALKDNEGVVFVVEGAFDALSIEEIGQPAVALNSTANAKKLLTALKKEKPSAILAICMDNDNAGENATGELKAGLDALKVPYIEASITGKYKDANEALVADPEGFRHDVEQAVSKAKSVSLDVHEAVEPAKEEEKTEVPFLETFDADFFNNTDIKEPVPIIDRILYPGLGMLGSPAKMGKSFMMLQLVVSVATGSPFMGFNIVRPGSVLYCDLQGTKARTKKRLLSMGYSEMPKGVELTYQTRTTDNGFIEQLEMWIQSKENPVLIVVDMLQQVKGSQRRTEDAYQADNRIIAPLHELALKYDICILTVMHTRKGSAKFLPDDPFNEIIGSVGQFGSADCAWMILGRREDPNKRFSVICRDSDEGQVDFEATFTDHVWNVAGTVEEMQEERANKEYSANPVAFTIRKLVEEGGGGWYGTMKELLEEVATRTKQYPATTPEKMKKLVSEIEYRLSREGINIKYPGKNGGMHGRRYKFYRINDPEQMTTDV